MSAIHFDHRLTEAISVRESGRLEDARTLLMELYRERPDDAQVNLHCAWIHDELGLEREAVPFYERALELGLDGDDLRHALLGLGSTYRALGVYDRALETLTRGVETFPKDGGMKVFHAMALYNSGRAKEACELLLGLLADTSGDPAIGAYRPAIEIYAADLDRSWA